MATEKEHPLARLEMDAREEHIDIIAVSLDRPAGDVYVRCYVVLAKRHQCPFPEAPYVTWLWCDQTPSFFAQGHYDLTISGGWNDFVKRSYIREWE